MAAGGTAVGCIDTAKGLVLQWDSIESSLSTLFTDREGLNVISCFQSECSPLAPNPEIIKIININ